MMNDTKKRGRNSKSGAAFPIDLDIMADELDVMAREGRGEVIEQPPEPEPELDMKILAQNAAQNRTLAMIDVLASIALNSQAKDADRIKSAIEVINRGIGAPEIKSSHKSMHVDLSNLHFEAMKDLSKPYIEAEVKREDEP